MKLITFLALASAVQGCTRRHRNGLAPPQRVCAAFAAGTVTTYVCASGADNAVNNAISNCKTVDGKKVSTLGCAVDIFTASAAALAGVTGVGAAILYGIGFTYKVANVVSGAHDITLGARDLSYLGSTTSDWNDPTNVYGVVPSLNTSMPMLTFDDVSRNLSYPFQFSKAGLVHTYFPEGFEDDESMVYTYHLDNDNSTIAESKQHKPALESGLGPQAHSFVKEKCNTGGHRHKVPYKQFPHAQVDSHHGIKYELLSTCGHHQMAESHKERQDRRRLYEENMKFMNRVNKAVLEFRINLKKNGYTFSNNRFIIETREFDLCYEGQHQDATCCA